jgi:hypothetical protein
VHRQTTYILLDPGEQLPPLFKHGTHAALFPYLRAHNDALGYGIFETVNQFDGRGRKTENLTALCALYADFDAGVPTSCAVTPSRRVQSSPGKEQWYWELEAPLGPTPENIREYTGILSSLVITLKADKNARDLTRVLRSVGYKNTKYDTQPLVREITNTAQRYSLRTLRDAFGYVEPATLTAHAAAATQHMTGGVSAFRRGLLERPPPGRGHGATNHWLYLAASWAIGTLGLSIDETIDALIDCSIENVWHIADEEIVKVARNADRYCRRLSKNPAVKMEVDL